MHQSFAFSNLLDLITLRNSKFDKWHMLSAFLECTRSIWQIALCLFYQRSKFSISVL